MTTIMYFALWTAIQFGFPVCDIEPSFDECGELQQTSGEASSNSYSSDSRDMRKVWKIYNGF